jgi:multidrug efflux pump subunit AcrA (membrane-fusion protein)
MSADVRTFVAAIAIAVIAGACGARTTESRDVAAAPVDVRTARVAVQPLARGFEAGGIIRASVTAQLTSRIVAEVRELRAHPGDRVTRGQVLVLLDSRDLEARRAGAEAGLAAAQSASVSSTADRESAQAQLALARAHHARVRQLREKSSATPQEMDRASAELQTAEAAVRAAEARSAQATATIAAAEAEVRNASVSASFSTITAPFDGVITARLIEPGNMASPGVPLLTLESVDRYRLELQIDESRARSVRAGDSVAVELDAASTTGMVTGRLVEIARAIDPAAHAFVAKVELPPGTDVRSGMFARARFAVEAGPALVVPAAAVLRRGQLQIVFTIEASGRARMRPIVVGSTNDAAAEILSGLRSGELVVVKPPASLVDGAAVRVVGERP